MNKPNKPSNMWYLLPFIGNIVGGVIGYIALKNRDKSMSENILIIGISLFIALIMLQSIKMISVIGTLLILFVIFIIGMLLGFLVYDFTDSIIGRITNWCNGRIELYQNKDINVISIDNIYKFYCSIIIKSFKFIDKIENPNLRIGLKLDAFYIITMTILFSMSLVIIAVMYIIITLIAIYLAYKMLIIFGRMLENHSKGLPLFYQILSQDKGEYERYTAKRSLFDEISGIDRQTIYDSEGKKVGNVTKSISDEISGIDRKTIYDTQGRPVGNINKSISDEISGIDRKTIYDTQGRPVGNINKSISDEISGIDRKTIYDSEGKKVGDISKSLYDEMAGIDRTTINIKKKKEE